MSSQNFIYAVLAMAVVMVSFKIVPILFFKDKIKNKFLQSFLAYIPYAVLTSMTFPEVFLQKDLGIISASVGVVAALVLAYFGQSLVVVALSSAAVVFVVEQIMNFIK